MMVTRSRFARCLVSIAVIAVLLAGAHAGPAPDVQSIDDLEIAHIPVPPGAAEDVVKAITAINTCRDYRKTLGKCLSDNLLAPSADPLVPERASPVALDFLSKLSGAPLEKRSKRVAACEAAARGTREKACQTVYKARESIAAKAATQPAAPSQKPTPTSAATTTKPAPKPAEKPAEKPAAKPAATKGPAPITPSSSSTSSQGKQRGFTKAGAKLLERREKLKASAQKRAKSRERSRRDLADSMSKAGERAARGFASLARDRREARNKRKALMRTASDAAKRQADDLAEATDKSKVAQARKRASRLAGLTAKAAGGILPMNPSLFRKYLLMAPRYYTAVLIVSSHDSYGSSCKMCHRLHASYNVAAHAVLSATQDLLNATAKSGDSLPLLMPDTPDFNAYPVIFFSVDSRDHTRLFEANNIQSVPQILAIPPTFRHEETALASFYSAVPSNGMHRVQVMTDLEPGAIVALAKRVSKATWHASTTVDEEAFTAKAVAYIRTMSIPSIMAAYALVAALAVTIFIFAATPIVAFARKLKYPAAIFGICFYAFNVTGGMFNKIAKSSYAPNEYYEIRNWQGLWSFVLNPQRWNNRGFRDQFTVEGYVMAGFYLVMSLSALILVWIARWGAEYPSSSSASAANSGAGEVEGDGEGAAGGKASSSLKEASKGGVVGTVLGLVYYVVFGLVVPVALLYLCLQAWVRTKHIFESKGGSSGANLERDAKEVWKYIVWAFRELVKRIAGK